MKNIIVTTSENIPGKKIRKIIGIVKGNTVRSRNIGHDIVAGLKNIVGGEIKTYTDLISQSRDEALKRMIENAKSLGADAVINVRFSTSTVMAGASEMLAYGTAVKLS